jgi:hypothetical protein
VRTENKKTEQKDLRNSQLEKNAFNAEKRDTFKVLAKEGVCSRN